MPGSDGLESRRGGERLGDFGRQLVGGSWRAERSRGETGRLHAEARLSALKLTVVSVTPQEARAAADAFARFGRHRPAGLNMGACFAYALAKAEGDGLLFKGNDFPRTDIGSAGRNDFIQT
ncbi:MAG: type II toxin-antitoxin system VapC family toxin [Caulobacter sp.]|nr:type II toxin-antitoxin system VapC family toxin [Caulobacter sp.]